MNLSSPAVVGDILRRHNLRPQKRFGQNFLVDANILGRIVDSGSLASGGQAFEIGAGLGVLTRALAERVGANGRVVTVELDNSLLPVLTETLMGVHLEGERLQLAPRLPQSWAGYKIHYRYRQTVYHITISRKTTGPAGVNELILDGNLLPGEAFPLVDDRREHAVEFRVSDAGKAASQKLSGA